MFVFKLGSKVFSTKVTREKIRRVIFIFVLNFCTYFKTVLNEKSINLPRRVPFTVPNWIVVRLIKIVCPHFKLISPFYTLKMNQNLPSRVT